MNPENVGDQIQMRHSQLWRRPMWSYQDAPGPSSCHSQMNQSHHSLIQPPLWETVGDSEITQSRLMLAFSLSRRKKQAIQKISQSCLNLLKRKVLIVNY